MWSEIDDQVAEDLRAMALSGRDDGYTSDSTDSSGGGGDPTYDLATQRNTEWGREGVTEFVDNARKMFSLRVCGRSTRVSE